MDRQGRPGGLTEYRTGVPLGCDVLIIQEAFGEHAIRSVLHVVTDGEQALQFLRHEGRFGDAPRPGLMLLDLNLPRRNGLEVLAEVRADAEIASIPIVMLMGVMFWYFSYRPSLIDKPIRSHIDKCWLRRIFRRRGRCPRRRYRLGAAAREAGDGRGRNRCFLPEELGDHPDGGQCSGAESYAWDQGGPDASQDQRREHLTGVLAR